MSNKIEYLVKYSVAPPPSRDYYGLKIFQDEVILYLWKISHGPHKAPIVRRAKLIEFNQEKSLQDEIRYGFGKHLLKHVKNIAEGNRNTLLTLPKNLIGRISRYLEFTDIIKLSSLSHVACEIFNADSIWQILYKRDIKAKVSLEEKEKARVYGWKQLYKDRQMQTSMKDQKNLRIPIKLTNDVVKTNKLLLRPTHTHTNTNDASKSISKTTSITNIIPKKRTQSSSINLITIPLPKTMSDTRFQTNIKNEKLIPQKRNVGNASSAFNVNEKNVKKENFIASKTTIKREAKNLSKCDKLSDKQQNKSEKYFNKIGNTSNRKSIALSQESKLKSNTSKMFFSKNTVENAKSSSDLTQNPHNKTRLKTKTKPKKKITATRSEIFNTDEALSDNPFIVEDSNFDLADLIEASLKNMRSPRSIFDYDFSCIQQSDTTRKDALKIRNEIQSIDKLKQLKPPRNSVITNNFSNKMIRGGEILEKLSERSESFYETSTESLVNDKKSVPDGDNKPLLLSGKYMKARADLQQSLDWRRNFSVAPEDRWESYSAVNFQNKSLNTKNVDNSDEKSPISRGLSRTPSLLKISNGLESRKNIFAHNSKIVK
ncbi:F-box only protein 36 [Formica fusca]